MIIVHHLNNSRSQRVLWLLEELGCPYQLVKYQRDPRTLLAPADLKRVHPLGKSPVISDGAHTLAESGAIIEYLLDTYGAGRLRPAPGSEARLRYTFWLHYAEGSAMPPLLLKLLFQRLPRQVPALVRPVARAIAARALGSFIDPQLRNHIDYWERELGQHAWFAGDEFTAADIQMSFPVQAAAVRAGVPRGGRLEAFLERPAHQRALASGGEFRLPA
jgi:glutathione S-transferase